MDWDANYAAGGYLYGTEPHQFLRRMLPQLPKSGNALCLAEAGGRNGVFLAENGFDVLCVDLSAVGLAHARDLAQSRGVELHTQTADLGSYDFPTETYEVITAIYAHMPKAVLAKALAGAQRALKPGGYFIGVWYATEQIHYQTGGPQDPEMLYSLAEIQRLLPALEWPIAEEVIDTVIEGSRHTGKCAIIYCLGHKPA